MLKPIIAIDVEATSIHGFIIELGWASLTGDSDAFLVRPAGDPDTWLWDDAAKMVHRIPFRTVCEQGIDVKLAAARIAAVCEGAIVCSDSPGYEFNWLKRLFEQAQMPMPPSIAGIMDFGRAAMISVPGDRGSRYPTAVFEAEGDFRMSANEDCRPAGFKAAHRAKQDAELTIKMTRHCIANWKKFREKFAASDFDANG